MMELGGVSLSVLLPWKCTGLVRASAVSRRASARVLVGVLVSWPFGGEVEGLTSGVDDAGLPDERSLPMNVHLFLLGAVASVFFSSGVAIPAATPLAKTIELRLFSAPWGTIPSKPRNKFEADA